MATMQPSYAATRPPSYAAAAASGRGLFAPSLDVRNTAGLTAFRAGPRRDPLSRQTHVESLLNAGRSSGLIAGKAQPYVSNLRGPGAIVPEGWHGSWETDVATHSRRQPLQGAVRPDGILDPTLFGSGAAGAAHPSCGLIAAGPPPQTSPHFHKLASGCTEEEVRHLLITNERRRRHSERRYAPTNTLGTKVLMRVPLPPLQMGGGVAATPMPPLGRPPLATPWAPRNVRFDATV